jgi:GTP-binding protein
MEINSANYLISSATYKQCPKPDRPEYGFIGRSNVGKSSLINMICKNSRLAKISATPGKTQLINHFEIVSAEGRQKQDWYLVDLPGYGYATVSQKARNNWSNLIESYLRKRENLACVFLLIDSRHEPQKADLEFLDKLGEWEIPFVLVFTKNDKNKPGATKRNVENFINTMRSKWEELPPYFLTSAIKQTGRQEILDYIGRINRGFTKT